MPAGRFRLGLGRRGDRAWFGDLEQSGLNGVVDPQAAEADAARLAIIEQAPVAGIAWNVVLHAAVADGQLAPTAPAADETSQQRVAVLGRAMMTARGHVLAHHPADRLRTLPVDVPVVRAGLERQPFAARLAAALRPNARTVVLRHDPGSTIRVGAAVGWVRDHSVDGRVTRSAPDEVAVALPGGKIERMRVEPEERLTGAAEFGHLVEDQPDRLLDPAVRILLQPIAGLDEADRCGDDQLAPARLLVTRRQRALPQEIELVLIETALEAEEQPVIALARRIDRLPVDEHRVDHAAHLDQLLPITAVAGEARHLPSRNRADLAETDLGHHPFEASPRDAARGRAAEIVVDDRDLGPAETGETIAHSVLQRTALAIV